MKTLLTVLLLLGWSASAFAADNKSDNHLTTTCQRYESKCAGSACYRLGSALKADKEHNIYAMQKMEVVRYNIDQNSATALFDNVTPNAKLSNGKYEISYKLVIWRNDVIVLGNEASTGVMKEKIEIDRVSGFYAYYLMHTDNTIKDVPLGEPYTASFGYCELPGVPLPKRPENPEENQFMVPATPENTKK